MKQNVFDLILQWLPSFKPKTIAYKLRDVEGFDDADQPTLCQIRKVIDNFKKNQFGRKPLTMKQLAEFVESNMKTPKDEDRAFVLTFERCPPNEPQ